MPFPYDPSWPEQAEAFLQPLKTPRHPLTEADEDLLLLVVHDHLHGVDIQKAYRAFYQKLQRPGSRRDPFLESVEMAQEETEDEEAP